MTICNGRSVTIAAMKESRSPQNQTTGVQPAAIGNSVTFEVASVKPNKSGQLAMNLGRPFKGRTYTATNVALRNVIALAYGIPVERVLGGPSWIGAANSDLRFIGGDRFDIAATLPQGVAVSQIPSMLRALLKDRFKLIVHSEDREAPIYAIVVARNDGRLGSQLRKASIDCEEAQSAGTVIPAAKPGERGLCESEVGGAILGRGQRISALARSLALFADRPVVDRTGLTGGFDFDLRFPELDTPSNATAPRVEPATGIFTAIQEQLGLKLEAARGNLEFVVIDAVDHPTEN
jgi:uncharacterized protein (TIGR03435 family)